MLIELGLTAIAPTVLTAIPPSLPPAKQTPNAPAPSIADDPTIKSLTENSSTIPTTAQRCIGAGRSGARTRQRGAYLRDEAIERLVEPKRLSLAWFPFNHRKA